MKPMPTDAELQILQVLWKRGPSTVREVHDEMGSTTAYTTALKTMQIMTEKGLVARDESQRSHVYRPLVQAGPTQRRLVSELVDKAFAGSAVQLAIRALSTARPSRDELAEVRKLLEDWDDAEPRR
jgi:predicted transcriptional regulator